MKRAALYSLLGRLRSGRLANPPVFIVGTGRCGTTLLFQILKTHPEVAVFPTEANDLWHPHAYPFAKATIDTPAMGIEPDVFSSRSLASWPDGHGERIRRVFSGFQLCKGKTRRFFLQSAMICYFVGKIRWLWPNAKIVHLVRDGRPVVLSLTRKNWQKYYATQFSEEEYRLLSARYWTNSVLEVRRAVRQLGLGPDCYMEMRYEALCGGPGPELDRLASFSGITPGRFGFDLSSVESRNFKAAHARSLPGWEDVEATLAPAMIEFGYGEPDQE